MISIVGNIKITDHTRLKYLYVTLKSYEFLIDAGAELILNIDTQFPLYSAYEKLPNVTFTYDKGNYGKIYTGLLERVSNDYVLNFMEDQFMVMDSAYNLGWIIETMRQNKVDVCKASFFEVEQNSSHNFTAHNQYGTIFYNTEHNHNRYQNFYGSRYYIGCNFLTTKEFALKFWSREFNSSRPHEWEIAKYSKEWEHIAMIPNIPIQASIDDDHGAEGSCLLKSDNPKFNKLFHTNYQTAF